MGLAMLLLPLGIACRSAQEPESAATPAPGEVSSLSISTTRPADASHEFAGLHNVIELSPGVFSGSSPEGDAGFESLRQLGIRTIISVDGATPAVEDARSRGMRYVHLPVGYEGIPAEKQQRLARAVRDLPSPIYIHCHHGKHRGPAAAASAAVLLGRLTPADGVAFLKQAGTGEMYTGLYACVRQARVPESGELDIAPADFPEVAEVNDLVAAMVEIDERFEHLQLIREAGWRIPADHPDLVPTAEAERIATLLEASAHFAGESPEQEDFQKAAAECARSSRALSIELGRRDVSPRILNTHMENIRASCRDCHSRFRDTRPSGH
ncbi:MAG: hypothetical protein AMXMBFR13_21460 [Phycisphaerae bacterium]